MTIENCTYFNPVSLNSDDQGNPINFVFSSSTCESVVSFSTSSPEIAPISGGELILINVLLVVIFLWLTGGIMGFVFRKKREKKQKEK